MKKKNTCFCHAKGAFSRIHLIDKCLIIFMLVLLGQSAYSLFIHSAAPGGEELNSIDIIIRTSAAGIFGYFLSANFIKNGSLYDENATDSQSKDTEASMPPDSNTVRNQIGFTPTDIHEKKESAYGSISPISADKRNKSAVTDMQIITATTVGLFSLLMLILSRNSTLLVDSPSTTATLAQFRDFISGSVGFLIGCPTGKTNES